MINDAIKGVSTKALFVGGSEDGKVRDVWATKELVILVPTPPMDSAELVKADLSKLLTRPQAKPVRQIYKLFHHDPSAGTARYQLHRIEG